MEGGVVIFVLILLTGLFAMAEMALLTSRPTALEDKAKKGDAKSKIALKLKKSPDNLLSSVQLGFTLMSILTGLLSGDKIVENVTTYLEQYNYFGEYTRNIATVVVVTIVTFLTLVLGELVPKKIGLSYAVSLSRYFAVPMQFFTKITYPFVKILSASTRFIIRLLGLKPGQNSISEDEIKAIIREGADSGSIDEVEHEIVNNVFSLGDRKISTLMTPRYEMEWIDITEDYNSIIQFIYENGHSAYPICDDDLDNIIGMSYLKDVFTPEGAIPFNEFKTKMQKPLYLHENLKAYKALDKMKDNKVQQALVVDEYGVVQGIISLKDFITALVGDPSQPEGEGEEPYIIQRSENSWLIDGGIPFADFINQLEIQDINLEEHDEYNTLAGLMLKQFGEIPQSGQKVSWKNFEFEVMDMDQNRIDKILVNRFEEELNDSENRQ